MMTGAIVAARRNMDVIGSCCWAPSRHRGGTVRDVLLGRFPVTWVAEPSYLVGCTIVSIIGFL